MNGPHWIKQWIADLALLNERFRDENGTVDFEALGREEFQFRAALITRNFEKSERARNVFEHANVAYTANVENGKKGGRPRKNPEENLADGDTREDSLNIQDGSDAVVSESGTSATTTTTPNAISTNDQATAEARQGRRTGGDSLTRVRSLPMPSKDELYDFAKANGLDEADARDWYEMTVVDRNGKDRDGKRIRNWKAALKRFCKSRKDGRAA